MQYSISQHLPDTRDCHAAHSCAREMWCPGPESNRHDHDDRGILSPLCLPISPPGLFMGALNWRLESESNRRTRSCSPLHNHSAIQPTEPATRGPYRKPGPGGADCCHHGQPGFANLQWSGKRDSNSRPRPWQGRALPTELFPLCRFLLLPTAANSAAIVMGLLPASQVVVRVSVTDGEAAARWAVSAAGLGE